MPIYKKSDPQSLQAAEAEDAAHEIGLALTAKQSLWFAAGVLIFFGVLLWFGYQDWQQQQRLQQKFEEHLRNIPTSSLDGKPRGAALSFGNMPEQKNPLALHKNESVSI